MRNISVSHEPSRLGTASADDLIYSAVAARTEEMALTAADTFVRLWQKNSDTLNGASQDVHAADNLHRLFAACAGLAACVKAYIPGSNDAREFAQSIENEWKQLSDGHDTIKPLDKYFGNDSGREITAQLKDLFATGIAVMRKESPSAQPSDAPSRPALPKTTAFFNALSRSTLV